MILPASHRKTFAAALIPLTAALFAAEGLSPLRPIAPTSSAECQRFRKEWDTRINQLRKQSQTIQDDLWNRCSPNGWPNVTCLHNNGCAGISSFTEKTPYGMMIYECKAQRPLELEILKDGQRREDETNACNDDVSRHEREEAQRKRDEEARQAEAARQEQERKDREQRARDQAAQKERDQRARDEAEQRARDQHTRDELAQRARDQRVRDEAAQKERDQRTRDEAARKDAAAKQKADAEREAESRRQRAKEDRDGMNTAVELANAQAAMHAQEAKERQQEVERLESKLDPVQEKLSQLGAASDGRRDTLNEQIASLVASAKMPAAEARGDGAPAEQLDRFSAYLNRQSGDSQTPEKSAEESLKTVFQFVAPYQSTFVPFASIPFGIFKNSVLETAASVDKLGYALENFDSVDSAFVSQIVDNYGSKTFTPKALAEVYSEYYKDKLTDIPKDVITEHLKDAWKDKMDDILGYGYEAPHTDLKQWWTSPQARAANPGGPVILVGRPNGAGPYLGNAAALSDAQIEKIVAQSDAWIRPTNALESGSWDVGALKFFPSAKSVPTTKDKLQDFAAGEVFAWVNSKLEQKKQSAAGKTKKK